ncbi:MAG: Phosphoserine phosphatase [Myxococcaceae bacterium]|nr:Phosphoserine phosphatase [Myxococcaceae bacterium]
MRPLQTQASRYGGEVAIAFFDLDLTLLAANSGKLWVRRELALGQLSKRTALQAALWLAQYQLGLGGLTLVSRAISTTEGMIEAELAARTTSFYERQVRKLFRPGAMAALRTHRASGDRVVLLTASSHFLAEMVAAELKLDATLCNRMEVDPRGLLTGRTIGPICYGTGKLLHARAEADAHEMRLADCAFYTDSFSDVPVLEAVGTPVAVNPDPRLRRHANKRGWRIVDWGTPSHP